MSRKKKKKKGAKHIKSAPIVFEQLPALEIPSGFWNQHLIPALLLLLLPFMLYHATSGHEFVLDDKIVLSENDFVQEGVDGIGDLLSNEVFTGFLGGKKDLVEGGRYRPLSLVTFAFEYELFGDDPAGYHFVNILWYALLGLLIFRVVSILIPINNKWYFSIPFLTALIFLSHPIHSEAVANIKGRDEIMTFTLALSSLYFTLRYVSSRKAIFALASGVIFFLALLAKENAITFLAIIPLTLFTFTRATLNLYTRALLPIILATISYLFVRYEVIGYFLDSGKQVTSLMNNPFVDMDSGEKYATIFYTLWRYIELLFYPHPLTHDYYPYHIPKINWGDIRAIGPLLFYSAIGVISLIQLKRNKNIAAYAVLFFIVTISITSNMVFSVGTFMNERFVFMPSFGFALLVACFLIKYLPKKFPETKSLKYSGLVLAGIMVLGFSYKTIDRVPDWRDQLSLNMSAIKVSKNSARINNFMGYTFYNKANESPDQQEKRKFLEQASIYCDKALEVHPKYPDALKLKAGLAAGNYKFDNDLQKLLNTFHDLLKIRHVQYIDTYLEYLNKRGSNPEMMNFYHKTGFTLFTQNKPNYYMADRYLKYGVSLDPNSALLNEDMCILKYKQGKKQESIQYANAALNLDPSLKEAKKYLDLASQ